MKKIFISLIFSFLILVPVSVMAFEAKTNDLVVVDKEEVVDGNLYVFGDTVIVNGKVDGDVICIASQTLKINGTVTGDIIALSGIIEINGEVGGSVRAIGEFMNFNGDVMRGIQILGMNVSFGDSSNVGKDVLLLSENANMGGVISGTVHGYASQINIFGNIGKDIKVIMDDKKRSSRGSDFKPLSIGDEANIGGNVYYVSGIEGYISDKAKIGGEVGHSFPEDYFGKKEKNIFEFGNIIFLFSWMIIGLLMISFGGNQIKELLKENKSINWKKIAVGILIMLFTPIICLLSVFTIIGIPAAIIVFILWIIAIYLARIWGAIIIGEMIVNRFFPSKKNSLMWMMVLGIIILWFLCALPLIGWIFCLLVIWYGLGSIWYYLKYRN